MLNTQLALLRAESRYPSLRGQVRAVATVLEGLSDIPAVQQIERRAAAE